MGKRDRSDVCWDELAGLLREMFNGLDRSLKETLQHVAAAPEEPFSAADIHAMVALARHRRRGAAESLACQQFCDLVFVSDTSDTFVEPSRPWPEKSWGGLYGLVGEYSAALDEALVTDVNSSSVDMRALRRVYWPLERPVGVASDPIVLDVWSGFDEGVARRLRKMRGVTLPSDVCLSTAATADTWDCALTCSTHVGFADYDGEALKRLSWN